MVYSLNPELYHSEPCLLNQLDAKLACDVLNNLKESAIINKNNTKRGKTRYTANP